MKWLASWGAMLMYSYNCPLLYALVLERLAGIPLRARSRASAGIACQDPYIYLRLPIPVPQPGRHVADASSHLTPEDARWTVPEQSATVRSYTHLLHLL